MNASTQNLAMLLHESLRLFIIIGLPLSAAVLIAGFLAGALQGVTRIHDHVISYSLRLAAVIIAGYLLYPTALSGVSRLVILGLNSR